MKPIVLYPIYFTKVGLCLMITVPKKTADARKITRNSVAARIEIDILSRTYVLKNHSFTTTGKALYINPGVSFFTDNNISQYTKIWEVRIFLQEDIESNGS